MPNTGTSDNSGSVSSLPTSSSSSGITSGIASKELLASLEAASSAAAEPAESSGDTTPQAGADNSGTPSDTTGQPAAAETTGSQPGAGPIPLDRHEAALKNAREKAVAETEARFAPFKDMDPEDASYGYRLVHDLRTNPRAVFEELAQMLGVQLPGPQGQTQEVQPEDYPEADVVSRDGTIRTYSDKVMQKALSVHGARVKAEVMKELSPFIDYARTGQSREQANAKLQERAAEIQGELAEMRKLQHFTPENEPAILEILKAIPQARKRVLGPVGALQSAYNTFVQTKVFPTIDAKAEDRVRQTFTKKANTSTGSAHPSDQGSTQAPVLKNERDVAAHMRRMAGE